MDKRQLASYAYHNCEFVHAINLLTGEPLSAESATIHVKALCELDEKRAALEQAERYQRLYPDHGALHYLRGMTYYLAGLPKAEIEAAFLGATERGHPSGRMGLGFIAFAGGRGDEAVSLLESAQIDGSDRGEMEHIRLLMLFQVLAAQGRTEEGEASLRAADRLLAQQPSLLRQYWGQLCWVRLFRARQSFEGASAILSRILDQLDEQLMPRLHRNALEAQKMIEKREKAHNLILPPEGEARPLKRAAAEIGRKPMLHSLFSYLSSCGTRGATKEDIVTSVWEESYNPLIHDDRIYKAIGRLRKLLGDDQQAPKYLTQLGRAYILTLPDQPELSGESP